MLVKWKTILTNWINCYFNESDDKVQSVTLESLLCIISHLRENLSLDESKSSLLEAHSVEEFVREKYPEFRFDNGTVEANGDDEIYMVASLLLFFVCVNSKDIDIKNAMCSNLSADDQEVILRFSKCLMECSSITYKYVQTAIIDACGPSVVEAASACHTVSETPPALRSLHGEVRRLQAALDAERFDRNYLQDELARTNLTVEKLTKDKEQYKLDIVNLKAKISLCCGQEAEAKAGDKGAEGTTKLMKELQQIEEKLVETQGLLEDAHYERDTYKAKVNELKQERDKWLNLSQQETSRASQLSEQLEGERRYVQSLKELVEELRQHRQLNRLDSSQLECDDPDASVQSLNHNSSICSEACANVVEVQLAEERAKIILFKQQIQSLQEQLNDLTHRNETQIVSFNKIVSEKDSDIFNLKHRVNEEIETRNKLEVHYSDENSKLNNEINELEQRLKDNNNQSRLVIEMKMQEIKTLQEEKLLLLQSLTDETTKLEGVIQNLKSELAKEKNSKAKLTDDYENHIMKLNEKVLNRNNELVELQNNAIAKSECIEELNSELRKERETRENVFEQYHSELKLVNEQKIDAEKALKQICDENESLMDRLNNNYSYTEELSKELNQLKHSYSELKENYNSLVETKEMLINKIVILDKRHDEQCKKVENCINLSNEERNNCKKHIEVYETRITKLTETIDETRAEISRQRDSYKTVLESRARDIQTLQQEKQSLQDELNDMKHQLDLKVHSLNEKLLDNEKLTEKLKQSYECQIENLNVMVSKVTKYLKDKSIELDTAKKDKEKLQEIIDSNNEDIKCLEEEIKSHKSNQEKLISEFETERLVLKNMITVTESIIKDQKLSLNEVIANHVKDNETLKEELKDVNHKLELAEAKVQEKEELSKNLMQELTALGNEREELDIHYKIQKQQLNTIIGKLNEELTMKVSQLELIEAQHKDLSDVLQKQSNDHVLLEVNKNELKNKTKKLKEQNESLICELTNLELHNKDLENKLQASINTITRLEESNNDSINDKNTLKKDVEHKLSQIKILELQNEELERLLQICKNDMGMMEENNNEMKIKKDLQESELTNKVCNITKELVEQGIVIKKLENELKDKNKQNMEMEEKLMMLTSELKSVLLLNEKVNSERDDYISKVKEFEVKLNIDTIALNDQIVEINAEKSKLSQESVGQGIVIKKLENEIEDKNKQNMEMEEKLMIVTSELKSVLLLNEKVNSERDDYISKVKEFEVKLNIDTIALNDQIVEINAEKSKLSQESVGQGIVIKKLENEIENKNKQNMEMEEKLMIVTSELKSVLLLNEKIISERDDYISKVKEFEVKLNIDTIALNDQIVEINAEKSKLSQESVGQGIVIKKLENELEDKNKQNMEMEEKLMIATSELKSVLLLNEKINSERDDYISKVKEFEVKLNIDTIALNDQIVEMNAEKSKLSHIVEENKLVIKSLEDEVNSEKRKQEKLLSQKKVLMRKIEVSKSVIKKQKENQNKTLSDHAKTYTSLRKEIKNLKKFAEMCRQKDSYITVLESKAGEVQTLQQENLSLQDELIEVKHQLDLKVQSLNEKLLDNEKLTEKLKQSYECQIENLNEMVTKVTNYLKEKTMELDTAKKDIERLQEIIDSNNEEMCRHKDSYTTVLESKAGDVQTLQQENLLLQDKLIEVKHQLDLKVQSLNDKLLENENLTEKLKQSYECQIENLNVMVTKVTNYLKEKTMELDTARKDKERLQEIIDSNNEIVKSLEEKVKSHKSNQETLINEFETERLVLKNMITVTESIMKDQKLSLKEVIANHVKDNETLKEELKDVNNKLELAEAKVQEKEELSKTLIQELAVLRHEKEKMDIDYETQERNYNTVIGKLNEELTMKVTHLELVELQQKEQTNVLQKRVDDLAIVEENKKEMINEIKTLKERNESLVCEITNLKQQKLDLEYNLQTTRNMLTQLEENNNGIIIDNNALKMDVDFKFSQIKLLESQNEELTGLLQICKNDIQIMEESNNEMKIKKDLQETEFTNKVDNISKELAEQMTVNKMLENELEDKIKQNTEMKEKVLMCSSELTKIITERDDNISKVKEFESKIKTDTMTLHYQIAELNAEKSKLLHIVEENKLEYETRAAKLLQENNKEITTLEEEIKTLRCKVDDYEKDLKVKDCYIKDKEEFIHKIQQELIKLKAAKENLQIELEDKVAMVSELKQKMDDSNSKEVLRALRNEEWVRAIGQRDIYAVAGSERTGSNKHSSQHEKDYREFHHQVDNTTSDLTHSSMDSIKTISDLEKIINDKNRTITTLQSDITYLKSLVADSENKLLDVTKELEVSKENCQQLSNQLKKIVHQKNEEIAELKRQLSKMSVTENKASQIIKVSAKYQAIILKRIAEIKTNTVLKELTNFGNSSNGENEFRRSLNAGTVTMDDLENFLETTDKHLRRCSEKQMALQKERDRLTEVNRINESENINLRKFLTELSVSFKTFSNVKELYAQKLSRVVSVQRTVRREILNLDSQINDATMCKLERGYAAVMQDLSECVMNLERWVERCIGRTISPEKIKQAFTSDDERASIASTTFQNTSLEVQLDELENSFKKLLEEVVRAQNGEGARDAQSVTVMEVRAEYEDKLNRMKAKMKQLYQEQILVYKEKQREEMVSLERQLAKTQDKLAMSSKRYEDYIRSLTVELWRVGEKCLKKNELELMQKKQRSGSLMSLQHVHSSGLVPPQEEASRISDAHSLRSLQVNSYPNPSKREARTLHMSDEEGEVFDNRWLRELSATPGRGAPSPPPRLSELRWRNSLCPPHLKSSYPAETQFAPALDEEDIKCMGAASLGGRNQRKEVGITAYKKPGPPTPSKNAGRLSATDSELRESLRPEPELPPRKTSTPSRLRALFRSNKNDTNEGTPRSKRLSIFRKK